ncbi:unnamed protein product [Caenorhabditis brenneri]
MENKVSSKAPPPNSAEIKKEVSIKAPEQEDTLKWAKDYVAQMNDDQRKFLQNLYDTAQEQKKIEEEEKAKKEQQQSILDSLIRQVPITVDVRRSSASPDSQLSSDSCNSVMDCLNEEDVLTVKDVIMGNMKRQHQQYRVSSPYEPLKSIIYRPRGSRERVLFDNYMFVFDKLSYDAKKKFFRCERKNTCPARIHTPYDSERVIQRVQTHNHPAPTSNELIHYEIDYMKVRHGHILPLTMTTKNYVVHQPLPTSMLTPQSEVDEEKEEEEQKDPSPMDILNKMIAPKEEPKDTILAFEMPTIKEEESVDPKPTTLSIPQLFYKTREQKDHEVDMMLTKYLLKNHELLKALSAKEGELPIFFPDAKKEDLVLFVADFNQENEPYQMLKVEERNERSIRTAIEKHIGSKCNRSLMLNVSAKINVPLQQHMIDQWKTEEFIRLDSSKPNCWKIHTVVKVDE